MIDITADNIATSTLRPIIIIVSMFAVVGMGTTVVFVIKFVIYVYNFFRPPEPILFEQFYSKYQIYHDYFKFIPGFGILSKLNFISFLFFVSDLIQRK